MIPLVLHNRDIIACSRTGSGKTAAYLVPIIDRLGSHSAQVGTRVLIMVPTRELAMQVIAVVKALTRGTDLRHALFIGGHDYEGQFEALASNPDIAVATPGRLAELLSQAELSLKRIETVVFDEADALFDPGLRIYVEEILSKINVNRQTLLFSATIPEQIKEFAQAGLKDFVFVKLDSEHSLHPQLVLKVLNMREEEKFAMATALMRDFIARKEQTIFFVASRYHVEFLEHLWGNTFKVNGAFLTGHMDIEHRETELGLFRRGEKLLLVATDLCARGVDIPEVKNVISIDFPISTKTFIHRCGRTLRTGNRGVAYLLANRTELPYVFSLADRGGKRVVKPEVQDQEGSIVVGKVSEEFFRPVIEEIRNLAQFDEELKKLGEIAIRSMEKFH